MHRFDRRFHFVLIRAGTRGPHAGHLRVARNLQALDEHLALVRRFHHPEALQDRTEGWVAGLQLAGLSLRDCDDRSDFIASFAGDDRQIVDYLGFEVLDHQPDGVREFLRSIGSNRTHPLLDGWLAKHEKYRTNLAGFARIWHERLLRNGENGSNPRDARCGRGSRARGDRVLCHRPKRFRAIPSH